MSFSQQSAFNQTDLSSLSDEIREQILFPRQAANTRFVTLPATTIYMWQGDLEDALWEIEDGSAAGIERAVQMLDQLRMEIEAKANDTTA